MSISVATWSPRLMKTARLHQAKWQLVWKKLLLALHSAQIVWQERGEQMLL